MVNGLPGRETPQRYLTAAFDLGIEFGGQTRAMLRRHRALSERLGLQGTLLTFRPRSTWGRRLDDLRRHALLAEDAPVRNLYEEIRDDPRVSDASPIGLPRQHLGNPGEPQVGLDDRQWRRPMLDSAGETIGYEYLRRDGSTYLRVPTFSLRTPRTWPSAIEVTNADGEVVRRFTSLNHWYGDWVGRMASPDDEAFLFVDSRFLVPHLLPAAEGLTAVQLLHNPHTRPPHDWNTPVIDSYRHALRHVPEADAVVTVTQRQRDDLGELLGPADHLSYCHHPLAPRPGTAQRDPDLVVVVARLTVQKRIDEALRVLAMVRVTRPGTRLEVFGDGNQREQLERLADELGLREHVVFHGHHDDASAAFARATASLVTSDFEAWNLALQESLASGCPVVAYDARYGPAEQVDDGVNGFLVPLGDRRQMADRLLTVLSEPETARRLGDAAVARCREAEADFDATWRRILAEAAESSRRRTGLLQVDLEVLDLASPGFVRTRPWGPVGRPGGDDLGLQLTLRADVRTETGPVPVSAQRWRLQLVGTSTPDRIDLPLRSSRDEHGVLVSQVDSLDLHGLDAGVELELRVQVAVGSRCWSARVRHVQPSSGMAAPPWWGGIVTPREPTTRSSTETRPPGATDIRARGRRLPAMWKERVNGVLRAATGYQLQRPTPADAPGPGHPAAKAAGPAKPAKPAKKASPAKPSYDDAAMQIMQRVKPRTMTGREKLFGLISAVRYVVRHDVPGDVVECGVWRGGSMQAVALTLQEVGARDRRLHLFDTFEGMPEPGEKDLRFDGVPAADLLASHSKSAKIWAIAGLEDVQEAMSEVAYPPELVEYHRGRVEETIPAQAPDRISILRLDTDWYESTRHELDHLYDRLSPGGVLIIDDYAYFEGSRLATDEWLERTNERLLLLPANSGRIAVKPWA